MNKRPQPVLWMLYRAHRQLKNERKAHRETRHELALARARQMNSAEELVDTKAELRRLELNHQFLVDCRLETYGAWLDGEKPG